MTPEQKARDLISALWAQNLDHDTTWGTCRKGCGQPARGGRVCCGCLIRDAQAETGSMAPMWLFGAIVELRAREREVLEAYKVKQTPSKGNPT